MPTSLSELINQLRSDIEGVAATSVPLWHPLGFVSCEVFRHPSGVVARVHHWPRNARRTKSPDWPIHTHSYALQSRVLEGRVRDIQYSSSPLGLRRVYSVEYMEGGSRIVKTDKMVNLEAVVDVVREAGSEYSVPRGAFHQTHVPKSESATTFVLLADHSNVAPEVIGTDEEPTYPYERVPYDSSLFWSAVRRALGCSPTPPCT